MKWAGQPPRLTAEQVRRAQQVRRVLNSVPSLARLAREWGVSQRTVCRAARQTPKRYMGT